MDRREVVERQPRVGELPDVQGNGGQEGQRLQRESQDRREDARFWPRQRRRPRRRRARRLPIQAGRVDEAVVQHNNLDGAASSSDCLPGEGRIRFAAAQHRPGTQEHHSCQGHVSRVEPERHACPGLDQGADATVSPAAPPPAAAAATPPRLSGPLHVELPVAPITRRNAALRPRSLSLFSRTPPSAAARVYRPPAPPLPVRCAAPDVRASTISTSSSSTPAAPRPRASQTLRRSYAAVLPEAVPVPLVSIPDVATWTVHPRLSEITTITGAS